MNILKNEIFFLEQMEKYNIFDITTLEEIFDFKTIIRNKNYS